MIRRPSRPAASLAPLLAVVALVAGGCGEAADQVSEKTVERQLEDATGDDVDVDVDGDSVKVETSDGTVEAGTGQLPQGYPEGQVPVVDGEIVLGIAAGADGFSVAVNYDGSVDDAWAAARDALTSAGMSEEEGAPVAGEAGGAFTGNGYNAFVTVADSSGDTLVSYIVSKG